jgi:hypothetical protein
MLRRIILAPLLAVLLVLGNLGLVQAGSVSGEVFGEAYWLLEESTVIQPIEPNGVSGWYRDQITLPYEGVLVLPTGPVEVSGDTTLRRVFNQTFLDYVVALDTGDIDGVLTNGDWDGIVVGPQTLSFDSVTCEGQVVGFFGPGFQSPATSNLRCSDGAKLTLVYNGSPELLGSGFDDITGSIRW